MFWVIFGCLFLEMLFFYVLMFSIDFLIPNFSVFAIFGVLGDFWLFVYGIFFFLRFLFWFLMMILKFLVTFSPIKQFLGEWNVLCFMFSIDCF